MKIVSIFEGKLFSIHYESEAKNEYRRLMALWTDVYYLRAYAKQNKIGNIQAFIEQIMDDADYI